MGERNRARTGVGNHAPRPEDTNIATVPWQVDTGCSAYEDDGRMQ